MVDVTNDDFQNFIQEAHDALPGEHAQNIKNVAILWEEEPTPQQREQLQLRHDQTLFGLYEGIPLAFRQGQTRIFPDKITLFKGPLTRSVNTVPQLKEQIKHTLWHEIAHYYGLNHDQIHDLE